LLFLAVVFAQQRVSLQTSDYASDPNAGASFDFSPASASYICNQVCPQFYLNKDGLLNGYFLFSFLSIIEVNATGGDCCKSGNCNPMPTNCDFHQIFGFYNIFRTNVTGKSVNFNGNIPNAPAATSECTQSQVASGFYQLCVNVDLTFEIIDTETTRQIAGQTVTIKPDSAWVTLKISNWAFGPGSTGYRLVVDLSTENVDISKFSMLPGGETNPQPATGLYDGMTAVDLNGKQGSVVFEPFVIYDDSPNVPANISITGPLPDATSVTGKQLSIFIPRKSTSNAQTLYLNLYLPYLTGDQDEAGSASAISTFAVLIAAVIVNLTT